MKSIVSGERVLITDSGRCGIVQRLRRQHKVSILKLIRRAGVPRRKNWFERQPIGRWENSEVRFASFIKKTATCWIWTGSKSVHGYGRMSFHGRRQPAHRIAWSLYNGPIPDGLLVCHHCDNPPCVNPDQKGKNILINDPVRGDRHWLRGPKGAIGRREIAERIRKEHETGRRIAVRCADGRYAGSRMAERAS